jgi:hypothetical protein
MVAACKLSLGHRLAPCPTNLLQFKIHREGLMAIPGGCPKDTALLA